LAKEMLNLGFNISDTIPTVKCKAFDCNMWAGKGDVKLGIQYFRHNSYSQVQSFWLQYVSYQNSTCSQNETQNEAY
jgi:hypothetical protein